MITAREAPLDEQHRVAGVDYIWMCVEDSFKTDFLGTGLLHEALAIIERSEANKEPIVVHWWVLSFGLCPSTHMI